MCPISTPVARSAQWPVRSGGAPLGIRPRVGDDAPTVSDPSTAPAYRPTRLPSVADRRLASVNGSAPDQEQRRLDGPPHPNSAPVAGPSTGGRPRPGARAWTWSALTEQPRGQSNSTGRPSTQPTAAARRQLGQSSQVTRSLGSISGPSSMWLPHAAWRSVPPAAVSGSAGRPRGGSGTGPTPDRQVRTANGLPSRRATPGAGRSRSCPGVRRSDGSGGR